MILNRRRLAQLVLTAMLPAFAACQAMAPGTFSAKGGGNSGSTVTASEPSSDPGSDASATSPSPVVNTPYSQPVSNPTSNPIPASGPISSPTGSPAIGPLAAADDPMGPRADQEGAGDCNISYALTQASRMHYSDPEGSIASTDKTNPTLIDLTSQTSLSAHFSMEALLQSGPLGPSDCSDQTYCRWDDRPVGYVRAVITPTDSSGPKYVDIKLLSSYGNEPSFFEGPPDLHLGAYNLVITNLPAPTGATIELHYFHNIYKKALLASDPMAGNPWAACNAVIGQPTDYSETPAP